MFLFLSFFKEFITTQKTGIRNHDFLTSRTLFSRGTIYLKGRLKSCVMNMYGLSLHYIFQSPKKQKGTNLEASKQKQIHQRDARNTFTFMGNMASLQNVLKCVDVSPQHKI